MKQQSMKRVTGGKQTAIGGGLIAVPFEKANGEQTTKFVAFDSRVADPSLAQARVCDLEDRDFGALHTLTYPTLRKRQKGTASSQRDRTRQTMMRKLTGDTSTYENTSMPTVKNRNIPRPLKMRGRDFAPRLNKQPIR